MYAHFAMLVFCVILIGISVGGIVLVLTQSTERGKDERR